MKRYVVHIEPTVARQLVELPARLQRRVRNVLHQLEGDAATGCPLGEGLEGVRLYRGERFVLLYRREGKRVRVEALKIEPSIARDGARPAAARPLLREGVS